MTFTCPGCGRVAACAPAACPDCGAVALPAQPPAPPAAVPAWYLHAKGRLCGPLSREELAAMFRAGLVVADDFVGGDGLDGWVGAGLAAQALDLEATPAFAQGAASPGAVPPAVPVPVATPASALAPVALAPVQRVVAWRFVAFWAAGLLALQFALVPKNVLGVHPPLEMFLAHVAGRFAWQAAACWIAIAPFHYLWRRRLPGARAPLALLSVVSLCLFGWRATHPEAPNALLPARHIDGGVRIVYREAPESAWSARAEAERAALMAFAASTPSAATAPSSTQPSPALAQPSTASAPVARGTDWYGPARLLAQASDWTRLLDHSLAWTGAEPGRSNAWRYRGKALLGLGRDAEGLAAYDRALALDAKNTGALYDLGMYWMDRNDFRNGLAHFQRAADIDDASWTWSAVGWANLLLGEYDQSTAALERAVRLDPHNRIAWQNLIAAHANAGYPDRANEIVRRANEAFAH